MFEMPEMTQGEPVLYKQSVGDTDWKPAVVLNAGVTGLTLAFFDGRGDVAELPTRGGVRHEDDPFLKDPANCQMHARGMSGIFRLSPIRLHLDAQTAEIASLSKQVESMEARLLKLQAEFRTGKKASSKKSPTPELAPA